MKLSTILSFTALSATATLAFPLSPFRGLRARDDLKERDVYAPAPVRRSVVASPAAPTATVTASSSDTASATATASASGATSTTSVSSSSSSGNSTDTLLYSTITQNGSMTTPPASTSTLDPTTETASTTTETDYPQSTSTGSSHNNGNNTGNDNNNNNNNIQIIIRIKEVIKVKEVFIVEKPVLVAVQVNIKVRQTIIVNEIKNVFISRFDNWDQNVVDQLGLVISQQFDILTRSSNSGFENLSNDQYNQFVSKFISQFSVFQTFQLVDVQQFVTVLKGFGVSQLATFFGRSDALFSQGTFSQFHVNNDFKVFVQQLTSIVEAVSVASFNSDDLFGLASGSLVSAGFIQI